MARTPWHLHGQSGPVSGHQSSLGSDCLGCTQLNNSVLALQSSFIQTPRLALPAAGRVYGFDVQAAAVESTQKYLASSLAPSEQPATTILQQCHSTMQQVSH